MATSAAQVLANQFNAKKSTGPISYIGKKTVANNALKHGLFTKRLILSDEDPIEYQNLLEQLQSELMPTGILEQSLVERIAVALWRQKRLIRAESACLELESTPARILASVNQELGLSYTGKALTEADLVGFDPDCYQWCKAVLSEYTALHVDEMANTALLKLSAPLIYQHLIDLSTAKQQTPEDYLQSSSGALFFSRLINYCNIQTAKAEQHNLILEVAGLVRSKRSILKEKLRDSLAKYQIMLDNELYKAIRALRDAQEWRFKALVVE